ncbi:hypothetical protein QQ045_027097 [Rhodiola kirilowii]
MYNNGFFASPLKLNQPHHSRIASPPQIYTNHSSCIPNNHHSHTNGRAIFTSTTTHDLHLYRSAGRGGSSTFFTRAAPRRESPYHVLGLSPSATPDDIKRAYRKLALKYHPDVNKQPDAQENFMRIKHAYNTLLDSKSNQDKNYSYGQRNPTTTNPKDEEEDFYGLADFFRDVQEEFRNWETSASTQGKPKSLWEELSEIGEEFVEFLEKELNITDSEDKSEYSHEGSHRGDTYRNYGADMVSSNSKNEAGKNSSIEDNIDEIEATLAQLKRELGL